MKKILFFAAFSVLLAACGGAATNVANNANGNTAKPAVATPAVMPATPATAATAPPKPAGPKRIAFKKGEYGGDENVTLAAGASATFVVGAGNDQKFYIESSDTTGKIKITGGKVSELSNEKGYFDGITTAKGDITFSLTNPGKTEMKTKLSVTLVPNGD